MILAGPFQLGIFYEGSSVMPQVSWFLSSGCEGQHLTSEWNQLPHSCSSPWAASCQHSSSGRTELKASKS